MVKRFLQFDVMAKTKTIRSFDFAVIGAGLVGAATAYGLVKRGATVAMFDEGDIAFRASRANFGLIWIQSKGTQMRPYAVLSRKSSRLWRAFDKELSELTGIDLGLELDGGIKLAYNESEWEALKAQMRLQFESDLPEAGAYQMMERGELDRLVPGLSNEIVGGSFCKLDGAVNSLKLLKALHVGVDRLGGSILTDGRVEVLRPDTAGFRIETAGGRFEAGKVVLAAGLGNRALGPMVGLDIPVTPLRGQILVTQKMPHFMKVPTHLIRQTSEGSVMMGDSNEDVGFDLGTDAGVLGDIARRSVKAFPILRDAQVVRAWSGLRVMTPDKLPLYQQSDTDPRAFSLNLHSGVTLAPIHAEVMAPALLGGALTPEFKPFDRSRFDVQAATGTG